MTAIAKGFYPVVIQEGRYKVGSESAVYAHGPWVIIAGVYRPDEHTDAFGSDVECRAFWTKVDTEGQFIEIEEPRFTSQDVREIYVNAGDDPSKLVEQMKDDIDDR